VYEPRNFQDLVKNKAQDPAKAPQAYPQAP